MNPDYQPTHVGMPWAIQDACDYVRPSATQMAYKYSVYEQAVPIHKQYRVFEDPKLNYEERMNHY
jgi:hypothetical protein